LNAQHLDPLQDANVGHLHVNAADVLGRKMAVPGFARAEKWLSLASLDAADVLGRKWASLASVFFGIGQNCGHVP